VQNAVDQAGCVAAVIKGSAEPYAQVPWFWSDQYAMKVQIAGITDGHDNVVVTGDPATGAFSVFCFAGDKLLGVESVNKPVDHVLARRVLAANCPIRPEMVAVPGFDLRTAA
jgi:3-phenylpropionate/trans-cinnamate dioxygenase ferredoxin reductase subunit